MYKRYTFGDTLREAQRVAKGPQWTAFKSVLRDAAENKHGSTFINCARYNITVEEAQKWAKSEGVVCKPVAGEDSLLIITWEIDNDLA